MIKSKHQIRVLYQESNSVSPEESDNLVNEAFDILFNALEKRGSGPKFKLIISPQAIDNLRQLGVHLKYGIPNQKGNS